MKYTKPIISLILLLFSSGFVKAQNTVNSPFSYYGIGELGGMDHGTFSGLGNAATCYIDSTVVNFYNPASYGFYAKGIPLFSTGISSRFSSFAQNTASSSSYVTNIQHFALAFPVTKYSGIAFGLKPYSGRGYEFTDGQSVGSDSIKYIYSGYGGINEVFFGIAGNVIKTENTKLSFGTNLGFLFGQTTNSRKSFIYSNTSINPNGGVDMRITRLNDGHADFGAYFEQKVQNHTFGLSAVYDPSQKLTGYFENALYYATNINEPRSYDTIYRSTIKDTLISASKITLGMRYSIILDANDSTKNRRSNTEISFFASYTLEDWSKYSNPFDPTQMQPANRLNVGIQITPEVILAAKFKTAKYYERIRYRAGYYQYLLPYTTQGQQLSDKGFTLGLGFPIGRNSSVNGGFTYGSRGFSDAHLLSEKYYGINIGITIAPMANDIWFRKPKLN